MRLQSLVLLALVAPVPLIAQEPVVVTCLPAEPVGTCQARFTPTGSAPIPKEQTSAGAVTAAASRLQSKAPGPDLSSLGPLSSITDFLPRLAAAVLTPVTGTNGPELGFKTNLPLNDGVLFRWGVTAQITGVFHDPKLYGPLVDSIPASIREASRATLESGLSVYDNATVTGALNVENGRLGRSMRPHLTEIDNLADALLPEPEGGNPVLAATREFDAFFDVLDARFDSGDKTMLLAQPNCAPGENGLIDTPFGCFTPAMQDLLRTGITALANASARHIAETSRTIRESGFTRIAQLINNQPQLNFSLELNPRRSLVGPTEWTGKGRFEMGFANWNGLRRACRAAGKTAVDPECLTSYTHDPRVTGSLARADRVFIEFNLVRRNPWHVYLPSDSVDLRLGASTTFAVSGGYGAYFGNPDDGDNRDRVDLTSKYEFARDDAIRQNRWISTLFYTRHVSGQASAQIGLTYANRPEFVGDVTRHLSANLGFTYKLNQDPASAAGQK